VAGGGEGAEAGGADDGCDDGEETGCAGAATAAVRAGRGRSAVQQVPVLLPRETRTPMTTGVPGRASPT